MQHQVLERRGLRDRLGSTLDRGRTVLAHVQLAQVWESADDIDARRVKPQLEAQVLQGPGVVSERGDIANAR